LNLVQIVLLLSNLTLNKHLTSKLQFSPNFTLDSVADNNHRGKCDVGGFLIFEWTLITNLEKNLGQEQVFQRKFV
jgi:hypothetical protein